MGSSIFACHVCSLQFPSAELILRHHLNNHSIHKCHLCEAKAIDGHLFCPPCLRNFPTTTSYENSSNEIDVLANKLAHLRAAHSRDFIVLKGQYLVQRAVLFCDHNIPKSLDCEKCAQRAARHVQQAPEYVELDDLDF